MAMKDRENDKMKHTAEDEENMDNHHKDAEKIQWSTKTKEDKRRKRSTNKQKKSQCCINGKVR
jgi:hypothetical protein